jgi:hypothetical protein
MGKPAPSLPDQAYQVVEANLTAVGQATTAAAFTGNFMLWLTGTFTATVVIEASFDGGATFHQLTSLGSAISFTARAVEVLRVPEAGVLVRARCSAFTSGTIGVRISQ